MEILPDIRIMLVVFVVFFATMFCLNKFVFKPIISLMDQREQKISEDLKSVNDDTEELARLESEAQKVLRDAKMEAYNIIESEMSQAKEAANAKVEKTALENKEKFDSFMAGLHSHSENIKDDFRKHLSDLDSIILAKMKNL